MDHGEVGTKECEQLGWCPLLSLRELNRRAESLRPSHCRWPGECTDSPRHPGTETRRRAQCPDQPRIQLKASRARGSLHLPGIAVAVKAAVPWLQDLQKEQAKRQRSCCLAPGLPEELHSVVTARSWKLVPAVTGGWRWLTAPPPRTRTQGLWEGVGEKGWE